MSMNRSLYDSCEYAQTLNQSMSPLAHVMDPTRFKHGDPCRMQTGIIGGNSVSHIGGFSVDVDSELGGRTRPLTNCPAFNYLPPNGPYVQGKEFIKPLTQPKIFVNQMTHLRPCDIVDRAPAVPPVPNVRPFTCGPRR